MSGNLGLFEVYTIGATNLLQAGTAADIRRATERALDRHIELAQTFVALRRLAKRGLIIKHGNAIGAMYRVSEEGLRAMHAAYLPIRRLVEGS